ncbi:MAG TPA: arginine--tRNA ligase [Candidatus Kapabacteria bacterium]|nr:arginine--tRNA ligase [Candidatus Kapabacteria bacterium]
MQSLLTKLSALFGDAFEKIGIGSSHGAVVVSARPDLGQFQCNGALAAAKALKRNPREVAEQMLEALAEREIFADLSLAGPGFVNATLTDAFLGEWVAGMGRDERLGCPLVEKPRNVVVDFGGPNVAKAMHVGHLRSSIIGDSLQRVFRYRGDVVTSDVHLGDWGRQMGMLIMELRREQPELPYFDEAYTGPYPAEPPIASDDLEALYPRANERCKGDPEAMDAARVATMELQQGRPGYLALWHHFVNVSGATLKRDFASLGVQFDLWLGESDANPRIPAMLERLERDGFIEEDQGARVIRLPASEGEREIEPLIVVNREGGVMYGTTDLATLEQRVNDLHADLVLYVVDARQGRHFEQVFRAARRTGIAGNAILEHVAFGTMNGPDGKPFKTREGGVMKLGDLISMATVQATERMSEAEIAKDYPGEEQELIARTVGIAAVKYADLMNHRTSDYIFDLEKFTRFEGRTGAYLLYAAVRSKSILRKAAERGFSPGAILAPGDRERPLLLQLTRLPDAVEDVYDRRAPSFLCEYVYDVAQALSRFLAECHILSESDAALRASWLGLVEFCLRQFELVLDLLGIEIPERM